MKLIINKNCTGGSLKIYKFAFKELLSKKKLFAEAYLEGHLIVIEKFAPFDINLDILNQSYELSKTTSTPKKPFAKDFARSLSQDKALQKRIWKSSKKPNKLYLGYSQNCCLQILTLASLNFKCINLRSQPTLNEGYHLDIYKATSLRAIKPKPKPWSWGIGHRACI